MTLTIAAEPVPLRLDAAGVVWVGGTRVTLDTVVAAFHDGASAEEITEQYPSLDLGEVYAALAYYLRHRPDVDAYLEEGRRRAAAVRAENEARFDPRGLRDRLLARRGEFWSGTPIADEAVLALHDPLFFHQLGGFGALAITGSGSDAGYLLGMVSADRLGVVHAVAVHPDHRGRGVATRLVTRFARLASGVGARVVQAVALPGDPAARALAARFGAHAAPSRGHAGPGEDRVLFTRALPLG